MSSARAHQGGRPTLGWLNLASPASGGYRYAERVRTAVSDDFDVALIDLFGIPRWSKPVAWPARLSAITSTNDVWVRDDPLAMCLPFRGEGRQVALVYHLDWSPMPWSARTVYSRLERLLFDRLRRAQAVVVISAYWYQFLQARGVTPLATIRPGFDVSRIGVSDEEAQNFRERWGLADKPIVYIGNNQRAKGVEGAFHALKRFDVHLVSSGEGRVEVPVRHLRLTYRDYLSLLKAASVCVTMSLFDEGWCMTAHEAMLQGTPVLGSGAGGMAELLRGGDQIICANFEELGMQVAHLLERPAEAERIGSRGQEFARTFTMERFRREWLSLLRALCVR